jgi:hypothetical protein
MHQQCSARFAFARLPRRAISVRLARGRPFGQVWPWHQSRNPRPVCLGHSEPAPTCVWEATGKAIRAAHHGDSRITWRWDCIRGPRMLTKTGVCFYAINSGRGRAIVGSVPPVRRAGKRSSERPVRQVPTRGPLYLAHLPPGPPLVAEPSVGFRARTVCGHTPAPTSSSRCAAAPRRPTPASDWVWSDANVR